jgi:hypothetical protein
VAELPESVVAPVIVAAENCNSHLFFFSSTTYSVENTKRRQATPAPRGNSIPFWATKIFSFKEKFFRVSGRFQYQSERPTRGRAALNYASLLLTSLFRFFTSLFRFFTSLFRFRSQLGSAAQQTQPDHFARRAWPGQLMFHQLSRWIYMYVSSLFTSENTYSFLSQLRKVIILLGQET